MVLTAQQQALDAWERRIANATRNMLDLTEDSTYTVLRDPAPTAPDGLRAGIAGQTRAQLVPAVHAFDELWALHQLVEDVVAQARQRYNAYRTWEQMPLPQRWLHGEMDAAQVARDIDRLLTTPSIQLPTVQTPLARRRLADAAETAQTISPDALFRLMEAAFALLNGLIAEIDAVWRQWLPQTQGLDETLAHLTDLASTLGEPLPELAALQQRLTAWHQTLHNDPLTLQAAEGAALAQRLQRVQAALETLQRQRATLPEQLAQATQHLSSLETLAQRLQDVWDEVRLKVLPTAGLCPPPPATPCAELRTRLEHIQAAATSGQWRPALKALAIWHQQADAYAQRLTAMLRANQAPLQRRAELRDLLGAWETKAQAYQLSTDPDLAALGQQAHAVLYTRPADLAAAERLVTSYTQQLDTLMARTRAAR